MSSHSIVVRERGRRFLMSQCTARPRLTSALMSLIPVSRTSSVEDSKEDEEEGTNGSHEASTWRCCIRSSCKRSSAAARHGEEDAGTHFSLLGSGLALRYLKMRSLDSSAVNLNRMWILSTYRE